jgi:hypothetical protein
MGITAEQNAVGIDQEHLTVRVSHPMMRDGSAQHCSGPRRWFPAGRTTLASLPISSQLIATFWLDWLTVEVLPRPSRGWLNPRI